MNKLDEYQQSEVDYAYSVYVMSFKEQYADQAFYIFLREYVCKKEYDQKDLLKILNELTKEMLKSDS